MAETPEASIGCIRRAAARAVERLPLIVLIGGILTALIAWQFLAAERNRTLQNLLEARVHAYAELVGARLGSLQTSIARAAQWWITLNGTPQAAWETDSRALLADHPALNRLQWINQDLNQRWMVTRDSAMRTGNEPVPLTEAQRMALQRAAAENRAYFDIHDSASDGGQSLASFYVPVMAHNVGNGFIAGGIDIDQVMRRAYDDLNLASGIALYRGNTPVYAIERSVPSAGGLTPVSVTLDIAGEDFRLESAPTPQFIAQNTSSQPLVLLATFVAATVLVALLMQLQLRAAERNRKLAATQQALDASEVRASEQAAHLENIYNAVPIGLCLLDMNMRYTYINQRMASIDGLAVDAHIGRTPSEVLDGLGKRLEPFFAYVLKMDTSLDNVELELEPKEKGASRQWMLCSFHPAKDSQGKMIGVVISVLDVTNLKEAEEEKQELSQQLYKAQKNEALGRLTGGVAHDFNNMLGVIFGTLEFVKDHVADKADVLKLIERIELAGDNAADLVKRLLAFARQQPLSPRDVNIAATLQNLLPLLQSSIDESVEMRLHAAPDLWVARVDESQLGSAILNLVINARDAMPNGGKLSIELSNVELDEGYAAREIEVLPGEYVLISVSDTGVGMTQETMERAFEPFFTTKDIGKGTGLGLSMVFGFIKQSRGHIKIYSELGLGTTMKLYLPRSGESALGFVARAPETAIDGDEKILVVEDDVLMRETAVRHLRSLGYEVVDVGDGASALDVLASDPDIDLLFTDVVMPGGMNGPDLARRAVERYPDLKVLFSSGYTDNAMIDHGWSAGGFLLLQKPYRRAELAAKVRKALMG